MSRTISDTVTVGKLTYIFVNQPETTYIEFYRFKEPESAIRGKVGINGKPTEVHGGAIAVTEYGGGLRLYYLVDGIRVRELCLDHAAMEETDPAKAWYRDIQVIPSRV
ncbi:hypothetical protein OHC33_010732 [Knufia fluminis]|uniref:Uncharacterized protein n=2 Tax=Knufia TaxID=430999 RepID=A0AAN8EMY0_9EURO|nr:hypothetical protein OHC33_010732 [Knufia fluminis]